MAHDTVLVELVGKALTQSADERQGIFENIALGWKRDYLRQRAKVEVLTDYLGDYLPVRIYYELLDKLDAIDAMEFNTTL